MKIYLNAIGSKVQHKRVMVASLALLFFFGCCNDLWAACTRSASPMDPPIPTVNLSVPSNAANGTVVGFGSRTVGQVQIATCNSGQSGTEQLALAAPTDWRLAPGFTDVYIGGGQYPLPAGFGIRFKENGVAIRGSRSWAIGPGGGAKFYGPATLTFEVVKVGQAVAGFAHSQVSSGIFLDGGYGQNSLGQSVAFNITIQPSTCDVTTSNVTIPLGDIPASTFASVGSTSTQSPDYNMNLTCTGSPGVAMSISGVAVPGTNNLFGLSAGSGNASGIAVQLIRNNAPVVQGQNYPISNAAPNGTLSIPISARYYRTGNVSAGVANARAVATFTYN